MQKLTLNEVIILGKSLNLTYLWWTDLLACYMDLRYLTCQISNTNLFGIWCWTKASMYAVSSNPVIGPENKIILWIRLNQQTTPVQFPFKPFSVRWSVVSICTSFNKYTTFLKALNRYGNGRITKMVGEPGFLSILCPEWPLGSIQPFVIEYLGLFPKIQEARWAPEAMSQRKTIKLCNFLFTNCELVIYFYMSWTYI